MDILPNSNSNTCSNKSSKFPFPFHVYSFFDSHSHSHSPALLKSAWRWSVVTTIAKLHETGRMWSGGKETWRQFDGLKYGEKGFARLKILLISRLTLLLSPWLSALTIVTKNVFRRDQVFKRGKPRQVTHQDYHTQKWNVNFTWKNVGINLIPCYWACKSWLTR